MMAFWKKNQDPWDIDPEKRKKRMQETVPFTTEEERTRPSWAQTEKPPTPMACPWCGEDMIWGTLFVSGRSYGMTWEEGEKKSFLESFGTDDRTKQLRLGMEEEAWYCTSCQKLTMDISVAMSRKGPNYVWKDGKIVLSRTEERQENDL